MKGKVTDKDKDNTRGCFRATQADSPEPRGRPHPHPGVRTLICSFLVLCQLPGRPTLLAGTPYKAWPTGMRTMPIIFAFSASSYYFREKEQYQGLSGHYLMEPTDCFYKGHLCLYKNSADRGELASVLHVQTQKSTKQRPRTWKQIAVLFQMGRRAIQLSRKEGTALHHVSTASTLRAQSAGRLQ